MPTITTANKTAYDAVVTAAATIKGAVGSTDNAIVRADGTGTVTVQGSTPTISDTGKISGAIAATATSDVPIWDQLADGTVTYPAAVGATSHSHMMAKSAAHFGYRCDFVSPASASFVTATVYEGCCGEPNWGVTNVNSATGLAVATANTTTEIGVVTLSTGAQTNGGSTLSAGTTTSAIAITMASANPFYCAWKVATTTASTVSETFVVRVGLGDTTNATHANGIWFEWDANSDVHIITKTCSGGAGNVVTVQTTAVTAGTGYHLLEISKPAGSTTVTFTIDGVAMSSTGTCPTAAPLIPIAMIVKSAGNTARLLSIDYNDLDHTWATPRT